MQSAKVSVPELQRLKASGQKITALTAYDYPFARILDECGIDFLLVGDSLGTTVQGADTTLPVTMDDMVYHLRLVNRARPHALIVGDMPFLSYQAGICDAIANAGRLLKEGGRGRQTGRWGQHRPGYQGHRECGYPGDGPYRPDAAIGASHGRL